MSEGDRLLGFLATIQSTGRSDLTTGIKYAQGIHKGQYHLSQIVPSL
jgi:hypothetical protein